MSNDEVKNDETVEDKKPVADTVTEESEEETTVESDLDDEDSEEE